jgi:hypothetical protein
VLICAAALCSAAGTAAQTPTTAAAWLGEVPPLPATAQSAYSQWVDSSSSLKPGRAFEKVTDGIKARIMTLARPVPAPVGGPGPVSKSDQELAEAITVFPGAATVQQSIQAARAARMALEQKWHAELSALEQRRLDERSALPACHNEAGAPSQIAIRDVEHAYAGQRIAMAQRYLAQFAPLLGQLQTAVTPRIEHGDAAMAAWTRLRNTRLKAQLAPIAQGAESNALLDVGVVQDYVEDISKQAAHPVAQLKALERVYSQAKSC